MNKIIPFFCMAALVASCKFNTGPTEKKMTSFYINTSGEKVDRIPADPGQMDACIRMDTLQGKKIANDIQKAYDDFARLRNDNLGWTVDSVTCIAQSEGICLYKLKSKRGDARWFTRYAFIRSDSLWGNDVYIGVTLDNQYYYLHYAEPFMNGRAFVGIKNLQTIDFCYISPEGEILSPLFEVAVTTDDGKTVIYDNNNHKWKMLDSAYNEIFTFPDHISAIKEFRNGLAAARTGNHKLMEEDPDDRWGYIDQTGKWVIQPVYIEASGFHNGYASVALPDTSVK